MPTVSEADARAKARGAAPLPGDARLEPELLTVTELSLWLKLSVKGIYNLVESRRIPHVKVGSRLRFLVGEIKAWLEENRVPLRRNS